MPGCARCHRLPWSPVVTWAQSDKHWADPAACACHAPGHSVETPTDSNLTHRRDLQQAIAFYSYQDDFGFSRAKSGWSFLRIHRIPPRQWSKLSAESPGRHAFQPGQHKYRDEKGQDSTGSSSIYTFTRATFCLFSTRRFHNKSLFAMRCDTYDQLCSWIWQRPTPNTGLLTIISICSNLLAFVWLGAQPFQILDVIWCDNQRKFRSSNFRLYWKLPVGLAASMFDSRDVLAGRNCAKCCVFP